MPAKRPAFRRTVQKVRVGSRALELTNLEKVFYPETGFTKAQVIDYYARIAPVMVPHLKGRPLNMKRYPHGVAEPFFFQKEAPPSTPDWLKVFPVWSESNGADINYCTANDTASLVWLANLANLEFHTLLCRAPDAATPTMMVFDLDPGEGVGVVEAAAVALLVKDHLQDLGLKAWVKVSGGKGVQPYVPLNTPCSFEQTRDASLAVASALQRRHPEAIVTNMRKELRRGKVLIDYSQNSHHKSTVCVYSLRARDEPTVSAPVEWSELEAAVDARDAALLRFGPQQVLARVAQDGDLFAPVLKLRQRLPGKAKPTAPKRQPARAGKAKKRATVPRAWAPRPKARSR